MTDLSGQEIEKCGWAGPLLWVCTTDGYSIHFYDAPIELDGCSVEEGADLGEKLNGDEISSLGADADWLSVSFKSGKTLRVASLVVETARVFKQGDLGSHLVYQRGKLIEDQD